MKWFKKLYKAHISILHSWECCVEYSKNKNVCVSVKDILAPTIHQ